VYNFNVSDGRTVEQVYNWVNEDRQGRGLIMDKGKNTDFTYQNTPNEVFRVWSAALSFFANRDVEGYGTNTTAGENVGNLNMVVLRRLARGDDARNATHEAGHNSAGEFVHGNNYEYDQVGLQSNTDPYPSKENTKEIVNDETNRSSIQN
jgi:hypothetical protein